ncbi:MAG: response regulator [Mariprofundaceae bacterium]
MKVLLVDDDPLTHEIISLFIDHYGQEHNIDVSVKALHDPVQGLLELSDNQSEYDIILLDVRLPKLSGDEIYKSIAIKAPKLLSRIIFITASPNELHSKLPDRDLCVLGKPFRYQMLEFQISNIFQQHPLKQSNP